MKKKIYLNLIVIMAMAFNTIHAQYCGSSGSSVCTPSTADTAFSFENSDSIPCIIQGEACNLSIYFRMFDVFYVGISPETVDSIEFNVAGGGIGNLPCGLCWATNKSTNRFYAKEYGCINISGTTNDNVGQYQLQLNLKAWINGGSTGLSVPASTVTASGIRLWVRVQSPSGNCVPVDTSSSYSGVTAATNCPTGIDNLNDEFSSLSISPNPLNVSAVFKFVSLRDASYTLKISDLTGKVLSTKEITAKVGENTSVIERNNLSPGLYFLSITNGKSAVTQKFIVID